MPSRRWLLAGAGVALTGLLGSHAIADRTRATTVDWPMARYDAARTGYSPDASGPKDDPSVTWERDLESSFGGGATPILFEDTLYVVAGSISALEADTGSVEFTYDGSYRSSPAPVDASIYRTDTLAVSSPTGVFGLNAGGGHGLGPLGRTGADRWHGPGEEPGRSILGPPDSPPPVAVDGTIYAAVPGTNDLVALEGTDGTERFCVSHGAGTGLYAPAVRDGTIYVVGYAGELGAYDAETGENRWVEDVDVLNPYAPTVTADGVVVPARSTVTCFDHDGNRRFTYDHDGNVSDPDRAAVAVADGRVFVVDGTGSLHAIDLGTGEADWTASVGGLASPVVADGVVYLTNYGVSAFDAENGEKRWEVDLEWPTTAPIVGDERLYVVEDDRVLALEEGGR